MNCIKNIEINDDLKSICRIETSKIKIGFDSNEFNNNCNYEIANIDKMTLSKISEIEGKCIGSGYVLPKSIEILRRSDIYFPLESLSLNYSLDVDYKYIICNPNPGSIINCKIETTNKIGALGKINNECSPLIIIIPSDLCTNSYQIDVINNLKSGDFVKVKIVGKKFEQNDKKITCIAEIYDETGETNDIDETGETGETNDIDETGGIDDTSN